MMDRLLWDDARGMGYLDPGTAPFKYDGSYFHAYRGRDDSEMGAMLTASRVRLVEKYTRDYVLDVGIGGGRYLLSSEMGSKGYDVNPEAVQWLKSRGLWGDLYGREWPVVTFWDALEHIQTPEIALGQCADLVFVSLPVFKDRQRCLASKHYKPGEHIWYFTHAGFIGYMLDNGFKMLECNRMESDLGREGIDTFVFKRLT